MKLLPRIKRMRPIRTRFLLQHKHPFMVPVVTLSFLFVASCFGFLIFGGQTVGAPDTKVVKLYVDGRERNIPTRATTVRDMLERINVQVAPEDVVEPSLDTPIVSERFNVNVYRAKPITVIDEKGQKTLAKSAEKTPDQMARTAGFKLYPEDKVEIASPDESLRNGIVGSQVVIDRATPVKLNLFGTTYDVRTHAETVEELARERGVTFDSKSILPAPSTKLRENEVIFVADPGKQIASSEEIIPNEEETINDQGLPVGTTEVRTEGTPGRKAVVYEVGADGKKKPLQEVVITNPVKRVVVKGRKSASPNVSVAADKANLMSQAGIPSDQHASVDYIIARESGWRPAARNARNCIGLGQRCNATILISACPNWETDAVCQLRHFNSYAVSRYGNWNKAYSFWTVNHWW